MAKSHMRGGHHEGVEGHGRHGGHSDVPGGVYTQGGGGAAGRGRFGKDHPGRGAETNFIDHALTGGSGPSEGLHKYPVDRRDQYILTAVGMDNVRLAMHEPSSILDTDFHGGVENIGHSLKGTTAVNEEIGAAGPVHHVILPDH